MARRMNTSRAALDRLLDPGNASVTLQTLTRAHTLSAAICASSWFETTCGRMTTPHTHLGPRTDRNWKVHRSMAGDT